jgi:hypothetical protein
MNIYVYYHIAQMGNWEEVVSDQVTELQNSGLYKEAVKIYTGVVGEQTAELKLPSKFEIMYHCPSLEPAEILTLEALRRHSRREDFIVLYMHTKGVSYLKQGYSKENMTAWRKYMEYFCIGKWRECISHLDKYDAVGCEYTGPRETEEGLFPSHFRGNFWWSASLHLKKLPQVICTNIPSKVVRRKAEYWLGSNQNLVAYSMFNLVGEPGQRGYLYSHLLDPKLYR